MSVYVPILALRALLDIMDLVSDEVGGVRFGTALYFKPHYFFMFPHGALPPSRTSPCLNAALKIYKRLNLVRL